MTGTAESQPVGPGRLILVVGPSGAGKDTLIRAARDALGHDVSCVFPRRVVTRPPSSAEDNQFCDPVSFAKIDAAGGFAVSWSAHGLSYGVPASVRFAIADGRSVVCNVSRTVIEDLRRRFGNVLVIEVTAPAAILAERLSTRGRTEDGSLESRIGRTAEIRGVRPDVVIVNAASLAEASCAFLAALRGSPGPFPSGPSLRPGPDLGSAA